MKSILINKYHTIIRSTSAPVFDLALFAYYDDIDVSVFLNASHRVINYLARDADFIWRNSIMDIDFSWGEG